MPSRPPTPEEGETPTLLTYAEVADMCGFSIRAIQYWVKAGTFPQPIRFGYNAVRFRADDINDYLRGGAA